MASIYPVKGIWRLQYNYNGKRKVISLRTHDKKIAQHLQKQKEIEIEKGLVGDFAKKSLEEYYKEYVRDTAYRKAKTNNGEYFYVKKFLAFTGKKSIDTFGQEDVRLFLKQYDHHSPKTYNGVFVLLHRFFRLAVRNNYILKNPCEGITRKKVPQKLPRYLSDDEYRRIENAAEDLPIYPLIVIARYTGMRLGELLHLEWTDWDWEHRLVRVLNKPHLDFTIKNFHVRVIPISDELREKLLPYIKKEGFCFPTYGGENAGGKYSTGGPKRQMARLLQTAGIKKEKGLRFHVFRKTFASHLVQKNVPILKVSKWLGHSNVLVTQQHYAHLAPQYDVDIEKLSMVDSLSGAIY